ncbi:MAG: GxxExxY protein [Spirochaetes bacterium GWF1_31_7]|nr:MAG: GxxExxY protein [Spirochaetes bacterium GWE1_32_154]OHD45091.1 MAG: GxxExxY protein [Spirochaetes bacterium GWE2_31_10]OHD52658.1 MAG: GxxExxY protein [Spirochaetes bacterium GWF1_31_7]OHD75866.1 MAG: GxxExxY protein [Spirochaetes bacterium RIFOXYB1_FULL_32_8]HBD95234.1 GxxExxY protein [Spirochaetia bacterium]
MEFLYKNLTEKIIGYVIEVHKELGPGLLENVYKQCLIYEFKNAGFDCKSEIECPVFYKGINISCGYRIDILLDDKVILELKSVEKLLSVHEAQLLTYMKLVQKRIGLLINFNEQYVTNGIKRLIL